MQSRSLFHAIATSEEEEKRIFHCQRGNDDNTREGNTHTHTKMVGEKPHFNVGYLFLGSLSGEND